MRKGRQTDSQTDRLTQRQISERAGRHDEDESRFAFRNFVKARKTAKSLNWIFLDMYGDTLWTEAPVSLGAGLFDNSYSKRPDT